MGVVKLTSDWSRSAHISSATDGRVSICLESIKGESCAKHFNEHSINFLKPCYTDFKSVLRAHTLTLKASSVQRAMVCSLSISLTPSLPASCNALDRSLSVPSSQKTDTQEITDIKALSFQYR